MDSESRQARAAPADRTAARDGVFVSYRRSDSKGEAGRLAAELKYAFGDDKVFFDTESLESGDVFPKRLADGLARAKVVLVVIGPGWLTAAYKNGRRRIDDVNDWVHREAAMSLVADGVTVIPLLLDGVEEMHSIEDLPEPLQALSNRNLERLTHAKFRRDVADLIECVAKLGVRRIRTELRPEPSSGDPTDRLIAEYRATLRAAHNQPPGLFTEHIRDLNTVFVELEVDHERDSSSASDAIAFKEELAANRKHEHTLRGLMQRGGGAATACRWVVLGDPGAGKSTLARHLVWELAGEPDGPIPVYVPLSRLAAERRHPFNVAEDDLRGSVGDVEGAGLREVLSTASTQPGRVWLFLDGLDELDATQRKWVETQLPVWSSKLVNVAIAVFSRPVGYRRPASAFAARARIRPLSDDKQKQLLAKWLGGETRAASVWESLRTRPALLDACRVPFLLSLLALHAITGKPVPANRSALYSESIDVLLTRGHGGEHSPVRDPVAARILLMRLAWALQEQGGVSWSKQELDGCVRRCSKGEDDVAFVGPEASWLTPGDFLKDVAKQSGIVGSHDGENAPWRFLHRQFKELLVAEAMRERGGDEAVIAMAHSLKESDVPRWAESLGFACELAQDPLRVLTQLGELNADLALRVLPEVEGVDHVAALSLLTEQRDSSDEAADWDGDYLVRLIRRWVADGGLEREQAEGWLWQQITPNRSTLELAYLHYALECLDPAGDVVPERERFFRACGRWPEGGPKQPEWKAIPAGSFLMGSAEGEGHDDEHPQHEVGLDGFAMAAVPVTNEQYGEFDGEHQYEKSKARHPAVEVSWWEAYLYCRWLGGGLPTEAQWEYACRAGTTTQYWSGDDESDLERVGWYYENSEGGTHAVGEKPANAWGLHDVHGNVWEWTEDWFANDYKAGSDGERGTRTGNRGISDRPEPAEDRVFRGGSYWAGAVWCRSAFRGRRWPGSRIGNVGFRPARVIT